LAGEEGKKSWCVEAYKSFQALLATENTEKAWGTGDGGQSKTVGKNLKESPLVTGEDQKSPTETFSGRGKNETKKALRNCKRWGGITARLEHSVSSECEAVATSDRELGCVKIGGGRRGDGDPKIDI